MNNIINTLNKEIYNSNKNGILDLEDIFILKMLEYYKNSSYNINKLYDELKYSNKICNTRVKLPTYINKESSNSNLELISLLKDNDVVTSKNYVLDDGILYDSYDFLLTDILYSDNNNNEYSMLSIDRSDLKDGLIKVYFDNINDYEIYDESNSWLTLSKNDISKITYFTSSDNTFSHPLNVRVYTDYNGELITSNTATFNIDRSQNGTGNLSPTIGDNAILSNNRVETILTLDMFTTGLTPPYNDPEGDLIDAIRIDEISTANVGTFYLNNEAIVTNQIITREDLAAGLFTHRGADINTIQSDAFNFSARDEGSQIWIK